jgi:hypothetical protein
LEQTWFHCMRDCATIGANPVFIYRKGCAAIGANTHATHPFWLWKQVDWLTFQVSKEILSYAVP